MSQPPQSARHASAPDLHPSQAIQQHWQRHELVIWGAHGGAGTSMLAAWLQPAWDAGAMSPEPDPQYPAQLATGRALIITCRNTAWSAARAARAVTAVSRHRDHVAVLVVVSDGWPELDTATSRFQLLEPRVGAMVRMPFVASLRLADDPESVALPRPALRALAQISEATGRTHPL